MSKQTKDQKVEETSKKEVKETKESKPKTSKKTTATKKAAKPTEKPTEKSTKSTEKETTKKTAKKITMADLLDAKQFKIVVPKKGDVIEGVVTHKDKKTMKLDIGAKTEGVIADKEFDFAYDYIKDVKVGDKMEATVISSESDRGQVVLSIKGSANEAKWQFFEDALENETAFEVKGLEVNRGGLIVLVEDVRGFVPASQFGRQWVGKIPQLKGKAFQVKAIEVDREKNRLIFSERYVSEAKQLAQKDLALKKVKEKAVYDGVVSGIMPFGLFVTVEIPIDDSAEEGSRDNIGYVEGLIHISEISWEKVNHPKDYHNVGDRIKVLVLGIDKQSGKLNLSIKQLDEDPWKKIAEKYSVGTTFTGKVSRVEPFGVFVNVQPGVDGLIHATKLEAGSDLKVGDEVTVNVESIDPEQRRMSLSVVLTEVPMGYK